MSFLWKSRSPQLAWFEEKRGIAALGLNSASATTAQQLRFSNYASTTKTHSRFSNQTSATKTHHRPGGYMRHITIPPPWQVHAKIAKSHLTRSTSDPLWQQAPVDADDDLSARCAWSLICDSRNGKWWLAEFGTLCLGTGPPFRNFTWPHLPVGRKFDRELLSITG